MTSIQAEPLARTSVIARNRLFGLALALAALVALVYGVRFNVPPIVSFQMFAAPLTPIDDIEARHLANSPLWVWIGHGLRLDGFAKWALVSATLTGLAIAGLIAHVYASFANDRERGLALLLLATSPVFFHMLGWSAKGEALLILGFLGLVWARPVWAASLCAAIMVLALPIEGLGLIAMTMLWRRPDGARALAIAAGAVIGILAHSAYLFALGDFSNFGFVAKGFLAPGDQRSPLWFAASLWLEFGWFWLVIAAAVAMGLVRRHELALLALGAALSLFSTVPERPAILIALPLVFAIIERIVARRPTLPPALIAIAAILSLIQAEAAWTGTATTLTMSHWPATIEQVKQWAPTR